MEQLQQMHVVLFTISELTIAKSPDTTRERETKCWEVHPVSSPDNGGIWSRKQSAIVRFTTREFNFSLGQVIHHSLRIGALGIFQVQKRVSGITDLKHGQEIQNSEPDKTASNSCIKTSSKFQANKHYAASHLENRGSRKSWLSIWLLFLPWLK